MLFSRTKPRTETFPFPGSPQALDGHAAAYAVEAVASDAVVVQSVPELAEITGPLRKADPREQASASLLPGLIRREAHLRSCAGLAAGYAMAGLRTAALTIDVSGMHEALYAAAGTRLTHLIHLTCRAMQRQAAALHTGHDAYYGVADAGLFQFFAANVQEVADFTLIAHRIAEHALTPGLCAQDLYHTSHSVQQVRMPGRDLILAYLGRPGDRIASPTPAQTMLFGERRRRIPLLVDRDHPAGIGGVQDAESYFKALAAGGAFFSSRLDGMTGTALHEFGVLTGRFYGRISGYRADDADVLVIAQGAVVEALEAVVDYLRAQERIKAGIVNVRMFRPFPGPALSRMLKRKKGATVLECTDRPLAEDLPLLREVRCALDKAIENGNADGAAPPYPSYETYRQASERPRLFSGIYGVGGGFPSFAELLAVFKNMLPAGDRKTRYYLGIEFGRSHRRFPHLQTVQQALRSAYPGLEALSLPGVEEAPAPECPGKAVQLYSLSAQGGLFAGNLFARTLADALNETVKTFPQGGLEQRLHPVCHTLVHGGNIPAIKNKPGAADAILVSGYHILEMIPSRAAIRKGGAVIVETERGPEALRQALSGRTARWIQAQAVRVEMIDARKIASETTSNPAFIDQLAVWALFGAYIEYASLDVRRFLDHLRTRLTRLFGSGHYLIEDITTAVSRGAEESVELPPESWTAGERPDTEPDPPWTIPRDRQGDGAVFDPTRFWHSVGYFYDSGRPGETLADPYLAAGIIPASSSAFHDMTPYRLRMPQWLPEHCTGCGLCWTYCPDSALPPAIQTPAALLQAAMAACREEGAGMIQMQRMTDPLAGQACRLLARDGLHQYGTLGALLKDAFAQRVERMDLQEDVLEAMTEEFQQVRRRVETYPVSKTGVFFDEPYKKNRNGRVLSIAFNPLSCTGCGLCVQVCPEDAFEWTRQTAGRLEDCRRNWQFHIKLPAVSDDFLRTCITPDDPRAHTRRLFDPTAYHSMVGGDGASPGPGVKIAIHLLTATIESVMQPRFKAHIEKLSRLIERMEARIQGSMTDTLKINDFERFGRRLTRLAGHDLTPAALAKLLSDEAASTPVDRVRLTRWTELLRRLREQRRLYREGAYGAGRARMVMTVDAGAPSSWRGLYPYNPFPHPWVCHLPGDAPAVAEGLFEGIVRSLAEELKTCRCVELELDDAYVPEKHDAYFEQFHWRDFTGEERALIPVVLVLGHTDVTGREAVSKLLSSQYPISIALINTTGIKEAAAPGDSKETPGIRWGRPPDLLSLARRDVFVLQTTIGNPGHLMQGIAEGIRCGHPALFHIYAPDPHTSGIAPDQVVEQAQMACQSRAFPLFRITPERAGPFLSLEENPDPEEAWIMRELTVKEPSGVTSSRFFPFTVADWAFRESRFQPYFRRVSKGQRSDRMKPVWEYIALAPEQRTGLEPYIHVADIQHRHFLAIVSSDMIDAIEERQQFWKRLQELADTGSETLVPAAGVEPGRAHPPGAPQPALEPDASAYHGLTERLLRLCGYSRDPDFFNRSLREFIVQDNENDPDETGR